MTNKKGVVKMNLFEIFKIVLAFSFGYVFSMQFAKRFALAISLGETKNILICLLTLVSSVYGGFIISRSDYIIHSRDVFWVICTLFIVGLVQFIYDNWNIIIKALKLYMKNKIGIDLDAVEKTEDSK